MNENVTEKMQYLNLSVEDLIPNPAQPPNTLSDECLLVLSQFLKNDQVLQPVRVRRSGDSYVIVSGEPQWQAARLAGFAKVACVIEESDDPDCRKLLQRVLGESAKTVERVLNELRLSQEVQSKIRCRIATEHDGDIDRVLGAVTIKALIPDIPKVVKCHFPQDKRPWHCDEGDLTQEVGLNLVKWSNRILDACPYGSVPAFLAGISTNVTIDSYHENDCWPAAFGDKGDQTAVDERCDPRMSASEISRVVSEFPLLAREIIERRLWGDDWKDIAAAMKLSVKKVKEIAQRAFRDGGSSP